MNQRATMTSATQPQLLLEGTPLGATHHKSMTQKQVLTAINGGRMKRIAAHLLIAALLAPHAPFVRANSLPDLGDNSDSVVTEPQERAIGKRIMLDIRGDRAFVDDPEIVEYITQLGNRLVSASRGTTNDNRRDFEFFVLNDDSINAFALLGGFVGFHSGLILSSTTESELAGVMGHEIAHVLQRHAARGVMGQRGSGLMQLAALAAAILAARSNSPSAGQATEAAIVGGQALAIQNQLDYSRDFEREADRIGIQIMMRAGFDPQGMVSFFDRLLRANRHNDGKAPGYLRTHPLTTERIADMQNRVDQLTAESDKRLRMVSESLDYKFAQAKLRAASLGANEGMQFFKAAIAERTVLRNRADVYGLALSMVKARNFTGAEAELRSIRSVGGAQSNPHPWIENLYADVLIGQRQFDRAITVLADARKRFPDSRPLALAHIEAHYLAGKTDAALALASERLKTITDDAKLYEIAARCYERMGRKLAQHRAIGESYYRRGNLVGAIEQLEIAIKAKDGDFYESSSAEARLREWKAEFRNRPLLPGEKRDPREGQDEPTQGGPGGQRGIATP
jgi:predicted Zn-dependent protease